MNAMGCRVSLWGDENVLKSIVVMVAQGWHAQRCEYAKNH